MMDRVSCVTLIITVFKFGFLFLSFFLDFVSCSFMLLLLSLLLVILALKSTLIVHPGSHLEGRVCFIGQQTAGRARRERRSRFYFTSFRSVRFSPLLVILLPEAKQTHKIAAAFHSHTRLATGVPCSKTVISLTLSSAPE